MLNMTHCPRCGARLVREGSDMECQNGCDLSEPDYADDDYNGPRGREAEQELQYRQVQARRLK